MSALYMLDYIKSGTGLANMISDQKDGGQYLRNRQGNQSFSKHLAQELRPGTVQLSSPVNSITQHSRHRCTVQTKTGSIFACKRVIVSVPTCLYHLITFDPPLPPAKQGLGDNTMLGFFAKTVLVYNGAWWRKANLSGILTSDHGPIGYTRDTCVEEDSQFSLTCFHVGDTGRYWSKLPKAVRRQQVLNQVRTAFSARVPNIPEPINIIEQDWSKEPWIRGVPCPVMGPGIMTSEAGKSLRTPFRNLDFVGTETALVWKGYMEGAVRSGARGAAEAISQLRRDVSRQRIANGSLGA